MKNSFLLLVAVIFVGGCGLIDPKTTNSAPQDPSVAQNATLAPSSNNDNSDNDDNTQVEAPLATPAPGVPVVTTPSTGGTAPASTASNAIVMFSIPAGTGNGPWNSLSTVINMKIGQTLRIINNDSQVHRLHALGSPCPHEPANMAPAGQTGNGYDCVITNAANTTSDILYDHNVGITARFYVNAQ